MVSEVVQGISVSRSVVPDSLRPHRLQPTRLLCPWDFPSKDTGVGCHFFSRGSSQPRDRTQVSCIAVRVFITWATNLFAHVFHIYVFKVVTSVDSGSHHRVGSLHKLNIFLRPSISISLWPIQYQFLSNISEMAIGFNYIWNIISVCVVCCRARPASLPMGFSRQKYWSGLPFPFPKG